MNRGIYSNATGMVSALRGMDVMANNLANASTVGFRQDGLVFGDYYERALNVGGRPIGTMGYGAATPEEFTPRVSGRLTKTGNPLDLALLDPNAMFAVQTPAGIRYTRNGEFNLDDQQRVVDRDGNLLLDSDGRPIVLDGQGPIEIAKTGEIVQDERTVGNVGVWNGTFEKEAANHYLATNVTPAAGAGVEQGALEASNVEPISAMIEMIRFQRFFEMSQKSIQSQDEMTGKVIEVLR
jgi:flagellar basal body rod protein FlgG